MFLSFILKHIRHLCIVINGHSALDPNSRHNGCMRALTNAYTITIFRIYYIEIRKIQSKIVLGRHGNWRTLYRWADEQMRSHIHTPKIQIEKKKHKLKPPHAIISFFLFLYVSTYTILHARMHATRKVNWMCWRKKQFS